ncbi:hypothetical protein C7C56_015595 [Massilia glaciei]|uniref:Uncharacterized protein n=2 Tax=Massilia glaciei TaxID=1524097 RepID=A0A2U2HIU3_9BURK|nr:hypothetical protein C7C56_015595 [Massilia glaciei]
MLALPRAQDSWTYIMEHAETFIWDEHGLEVEEWNAMAGKGAGFEDVTATFNNPDEEDATFLTYKGKTVRVPLVHDREDNFISIHTLSQLVREDSELRYCIDSTHSSDVAFLALSPAQWRALESEFGREAVDFRFLAIGPDLEAFFKAAHADENLRTYADDGDAPTRNAVLEQGMKEQIQLLAHANYSCAEVHSKLIEDKFLHLLICVDSDKHRDALRGSNKFKRQVDLMRANWPSQIALRSISFQSKQAIARDEARFWSSLWWVEGACPQLRWDGAPADYDSRAKEVAAPNEAGPSKRANPGPRQPPAPVPSPQANDAKKPDGASSPKHWLPLAFIAILLAAYFFGMTLQ